MKFDSGVLEVIRELIILLFESARRGQNRPPRLSITKTLKNLITNPETR